MDFRILGPLEVFDGDLPLVLGGSRQRALLALLLVNANEPVSADRLIEELWGEQAPGSGRAALQVRVSHLRKALGKGGDLLLTRPPGYLMRVDPDQLDLFRFERLVEEANAAPPEVAAERLRDAMSLWRGPPLADLSYEAFAQPVIRRLEELRLAALEERIDVDLELGRHAELVGELEMLVAEHPLQERLHAQRMLALYRSGRQADALNAYQSARRILVEELGIEPTTALRDLEQAILQHDPSLDRPRPAAQAHADVSSVSPTEPLNNLPTPASSFVGREHELRQLGALLTQTRILTLTGAGGVGKTRLVLQLASSLGRTPADGVWFVDLAPLSTSSVVTATVASVLSVREEPGRALVDVLTEALRARELVLILDNCEHVIVEVANLVDRLTKTCPRVRVLATSREPLGIEGEHIYKIASMSVPAEGEEDPARLLGAEAVKLFVARGRQQRSGFALNAENGATIARVCRHLDGIPLAVELAAARLRSMSLGDIEARLDDRFRLLTGGSRTALPRQQTLRALVDWSYDLLGPPEQEMFERLSVFAGGFDLEAVEAVATSDEGIDSLDQLSALVDKSLVQADDGGTTRYRLLETVREYARSKLAARAATAVEAVRRAHRDHYLALAEQAAPQLISHRQREWLDRLELELDNLRAGHSTCLTDANPEPGFRLTTALRYFWLRRRPGAEGAALGCASLDRLDAQEQTVARGRALAAVAMLLTSISSEHDAAIARVSEALSIARATSDLHLQADALYSMALANLRRGDSRVFCESAEQALQLARMVGDPHLTALVLLITPASPGLTHRDRVRLLEESLRLFRQTGDETLYIRALGNLGYAEMLAGDPRSARDRLGEAVRRAREIEDQRGVCFYDCNLGFASYLDGAVDVAGACFDESLAVAARIGDFAVTAYGQLGLALLASRQGDHETAARLHGVADSMHARLGSTLDAVEARLRDADIASLRGVLGDAAFEAAYSLGRERDVDATPAPL